MPDIAFTTIVGLDYEHLNELRLSWPTWALNRPEIMKQPVLFVCDDVEDLGWWRRQISNIVSHSRVKVALFVPNAEPQSQRHKMLSALVEVPCDHVDTEWFLKLDTDCSAKNPGNWMRDEWFADPETVFVARKWGYTKPAQMFIDLCEWAAGVQIFEHLPEVPGKWSDLDGRCEHHRIISYAMFGKIEFLKMCRDLYHTNLLPIPSQDTFLWYVAERLKLKYGRPGMRDAGWSHSRRKLQKNFDAAFGVHKGDK